MPFAIERATPIWGCKSVGKPGYGNVFILVGNISEFSIETLIESSKISISAPISINLAVRESRCSGIQFFIKMLPWEATAATIKVPASIWSGTTE